MDLFNILQSHIGVFLLVLARTSGVFLVAPFFASETIPMQIKASAVFFFTIVLFPVVDAQGTLVLPNTLPAYTMAILIEVLVGWLIGFTAFVILSAINLGGQLIDMQIGFAMVNVMDPTLRQTSPLMGSFLYNICILVFLITNGHYILISALAESFSTIAPLTAHFDGGIVMLIVNMTGHIFVTGLKLALPVLFAILLTNVGLGVLARTMPQMNIFVVGIPVQIVLGLFVIGMMLPFYLVFLDVTFNEIYKNITVMLQAIY